MPSKCLARHFYYENYKFSAFRFPLSVYFTIFVRLLANSKFPNGKIETIYSATSKIPKWENRRRLSYFCALRSGGKRNRRCGARAEGACTLCRAARRKSLRSRINILGVCEHLRRKQGAKRANRNDLQYNKQINNKKYTEYEYFI